MNNSMIGRLFALIFLPIVLFANVSAKLDKPTIYRGDSVKLILEAEGDDVNFPQIGKIGGFRVMGTATSQSINIINGKSSKKLSKSYTFIPTHSVKIPSFTIEVDGKSLHTKPLSLKVLDPAKAPHDQSVQLLLKADKKHALVGENIKVDLIFKHDPSVKYDKVVINPPSFDGFWVKRLPQERTFACGDAICEGYSFILTPQQAGNFKIPPTSARLGKYDPAQNRGGLFNDPFFDDPFFNSLRGRLSWREIYSNDLNLSIDPLPKGVELFGSYTMDATVDKQSVHAGKPVNLTIAIKGSGNLDDIPPFKLDIPDAVVYSDKPEVHTHIEGEKSVGSFEQKIAIVADNNFTIPALTLQYYDQFDKEIKTLSTKPISVTVTGGSKRANVTPQQPKVQATQSAPEPVASSSPKADHEASQTGENGSQKYPLFYGVLIFLAGVLSTLGVQKLIKILRNKGAKREHTLADKVAKAKDNNALYHLLLPYAKLDPIVSESLEEIEKDRNNSKLTLSKEMREKLVDRLDELEAKGGSTSSFLIFADNTQNS